MRGLQASEEGMRDDDRLWGIIHDGFPFELNMCTLYLACALWRLHSSKALKVSVIRFIFRQYPEPSVALRPYLDWEEHAKSCHRPGAFRRQDVGKLPSVL